jgi:YihY family inner membrane protein
LSQFPIIGDQLSNPQGLQGSGAALVIGGLIALYGALGVAQAFQNAMNIVWSVPRHRRPNPVKARLRSLLLIGTAGIAVLATTILSALGGSAAADGTLFDGWLALVVSFAAVVVNAAVFTVAFRVSTATQLGVRDVAPGATVAAVIWQLLQVFGTGYVARVVKDADITYGVFAVVLGLLAWVFLAALGVVVSAEINVVRTKHLYPRALLTPFTDNVDLTHADQRAYTDAANAQRHKGFQTVDVTFAHEGQEAAARKRADDEVGTNSREVIPDEDV